MYILYIYIYIVYICKIVECISHSGAGVPTEDRRGAGAEDGEYRSTVAVAANHCDYMVIYGYIWLNMVIYGYIWLYMVIYYI